MGKAANGHNLLQHGATVVSSEGTHEYTQAIERGEMSEPSCLQYDRGLSVVAVGRLQPSRGRKML